MSSRRCTHILGTPSLYLDMICTSQELGLKVTTLQAAAYGGAPCSQELATQIKQTLNARRLVVSKFAVICLYVCVVWADVFSPYCLVLFRNRRTCEIMLNMLLKIRVVADK
jgi:acyl-CoA synthetase (AMP-forming)/AMP-acid ligase II